MSIVLTRIASIRIAIAGIETIRIGFGKLPLILGGLILGPVYGGIIGIISDVVGYIIQPLGPYMPHFTVISGLVGLIPPLVFQIFRLKKYQFYNLCIGVGITLVTTELFLIPYSLHIIFNIPWQILLIPRIISVPLTILLYAYVILLFQKRDIFKIIHLNSLK